MRKFFNKLMNPFMKWLLQSPFHGFTSGHYLLIRFTGRKSGKQYLTPIEYKQQNKTLLAITNKNYVWWKNLQGGVPVSVQLRGKKHQGTACISQAPDVIETNIRTLYPFFSNTQVDNIAANSVAIRIELEAS